MAFAGLIATGVYQFNVVVPSGLPMTKGPAGITTALGGGDGNCAWTR